jgi:phospholipid/cholesterol/gamma-HCH transport system substrate-binding protein
MKQASPTLVGVFVLGAAALIFAAVIFFGSGKLLKQRIAMVSYFPGSVAGLQTGAPVTFRGVRVGEVKSIGIRLEPDTKLSTAQVNMEFVPEAVKVYGTVPPVDDLPALVQRGLSAQLVMQSLVTGMLQVELDFRQGVQPSRLGESSDVPEIPTVPSPYQALRDQLVTLDIASTVATLQRTLGSLDALLTRPGLTTTIDGLPALLADLRRTVNTTEREVVALSAAGQRALGEVVPAVQKTLASVQSLSEHLEQESTDTLGAARGVFQNASIAVDGANALLDPRGQTVIQLQRAIDELAATAARLRRFAERVDRDPAVLLRGR